MWVLDPKTKELVYKDDEGHDKHRITVFGSGFLLLDLNVIKVYSADLDTLFEKHNLPPIP